MFDFDFDAVEADYDDLQDGDDSARDADQGKADLNAPAPTHQACDKCNGSGRWWHVKGQRWRYCGRCAGYGVMNDINQRRFEQYSKPEFEAERREVKRKESVGVKADVDFKRWFNYVS